MATLKTSFNFFIHREDLSEKKLDNLRLDTNKNSTHTHTLQRIPSRKHPIAVLFKRNKNMLHKRGDENRLFQFLFHMYLYIKCNAICDWFNENVDNEKKTTTENVTYLPIFVSSSSSDGARLFRRHNVAIIPMCNVKQHTKSMISKSRRTAPTATAIRDADVTGFAGITRSRPKKMWPKNTEIPIRSILFVCFVVLLFWVMLLFRFWDGAFVCMYLFLVVFVFGCILIECCQMFITYFFC